MTLAYICIFLRCPKFPITYHFNFFRLLRYLSKNRLLFEERFNFKNQKYVNNVIFKRFGMKMGTQTSIYSLVPPTKFIKERVFTEFDMFFPHLNLYIPTSSEKHSLCKTRLSNVSCEYTFPPFFLSIFIFSLEDGFTFRRLSP